MTMLLNYSLTLTTLIVVFSLICYCTPLEAGNDVAANAADDDSYANGVDLYLSLLPNSSDSLDTSISCIKNLNYKTAFLYFYDADGFNENIGDLARELLEKKIHVEYVISPQIPGTLMPDTVINSVLDSLKDFDITPKFMWMNVINSGDDPKANIDYVQGLRETLQKNNIGIGLVVIPELWNFYYNKWTRPSEENDLVWVDIVLDELDEFESFGGWQKASVVSPTTVYQCEMKFGNLTYRKDDIDPHFNNNLSFMEFHLMGITIAFLAFIL